jgi:hypothetical protein
MEKQYFGELNGDIYVKEANDIYKLVEFCKDGIDQIEGEKIEDELDVQNLLQNIKFSAHVPQKLMDGYVEAGLECPHWYKPPINFGQYRKTEQNKKKSTGTTTTKKTKKEASPPPPPSPNSDIPMKKQKTAPLSEEVDLTHDDDEQEFISEIVKKEEEKLPIDSLELKRSESYEETVKFLNLENSMIDQGNEYSQTN